MWLVSRERTPTAPPKLLEPAYVDLDELVSDLSRRLVVHSGRMFGEPSLTEEEIDPTDRKTAVAVSGGGAAGAYSAGSIEALYTKLKRSGVSTDILVGTSSGALNCYGLFLEMLGKHNRAFCDDAELRQPYSTFIAGIWSYIGRHGTASEWIVGKRSWLLRFGTEGLTRIRRWGLAAVALLALFLFNPFLFVGLVLTFDADWILPDFIQRWSAETAPAWQFVFLGALSFAGLVVMLGVLLHEFWRSVFRDTAILRLLASSGEGGDIEGARRASHAEIEDRARVLSREVVREWYRRADHAPELIITATDITIGRECLFTLVRPDTYRRLVEQGWMAVQLDSQDGAAKVYRDAPGALFTLPENLVRCVVASAAVPSAFPAQELGIYGIDSRKDVRHRFFDGGVINNSPTHLAIDAGATHIIALELNPLRVREPLNSDDKGHPYNLVEAGVTTFTTLLERASERDIRRSVTWNRFLVENPTAIADTSSALDRVVDTPREDKRLVHLYRIAPADRELGPAEFDGRYRDGVRTATVRDVLRRGVVDLKGRHIWRATVQAAPSPDGREGLARPK